uniref:Pentraxin (PTX) domain-containing protein n=1 Tax=Heliothis virescens TaxID=7102 RepID=A0A2A4K5V0_HELVI
MPWITLIVLLSVASTGISINRPVYKIVLKQKGYAQFLQYDIETPPLREFTICTWIRIYDLSGDQSIFTYVANGNNRVVRLWLDSGGKHINVSINGKVTSSSEVDITKDVWRHVCLSYQSDFGAWALYIDSRLLSCQASQSLLGFVLPGGGSVIIGYGTADGGAPNGLEGEIFGTNMILASTIERNYTIRNDPLYEQKRFHQNKMKSGNAHMNYIILNDLQTGELKNNFETTQLPTTTGSKSFIKFRTPHSFIEHAVGLELSSQTPPIDMSDKDYLGLNDKTEQPDGLSFWNLNNNEHTGRYNIPDKNRNSSNVPDTGTSSLLSEFETPPPPVPKFTFFEKTLEAEKDANFKFRAATTESGKYLFNKKYGDEISEIETPPPLVEKNTKVYGQWTSSKFAGSVLNYLKNINFRSREQKKVPQTIPLTKISDSFPYASDFKINKIRPAFKFQRRNLVEKQFETSKRSPQINVQILEDDLRNQILKTHAQTQPKNVEITNRGRVRKKKHENRFYRNIDAQENSNSFESSETIRTNKPIVPTLKTKPKKTADLTLQNNNLLSILPFLKSLEYFVENSQFSDSQKEKDNGDMYTRSLSARNKWHNVKSYSNDYTPREIKIDPESGQSEIAEKISLLNKKHPAVRLNYKHENRNIMSFKEDPSLTHARAIAMEVSNQSDYNKDSISILKYNHGFLPGHNKKVKIDEKRIGSSKTKNHSNRKNNFNKNVKIGNALNEQHAIGRNAEQNKKSFVGGNEHIPDIHKYRSDIDNESNDAVPASLAPRICKNIELYDRVLYVQPDESIDMTHILSPVRMKNIGIEFIMQNYKKCSLQESDLQNNPMLFIDWSRTPVRLFGGSFPKTTTDLCGFF